MICELALMLGREGSVVVVFIYTFQIYHMYDLELSAARRQIELNYSE